VSARSKASLRRRVARAVERLIRAEVAESWKGSKMPEDHPPIERELRLARAAYRRVLEELP
jgi:hypothetical protein